MMMNGYGMIEESELVTLQSIQDGYDIVEEVSTDYDMVEGVTIYVLQSIQHGRTVIILPETFLNGTNPIIKWPRVKGVGHRFESLFGYNILRSSLVLEM